MTPVAQALSPWRSQAEAAEYLGVTTRTIRAYIARGDLKAGRVRGSSVVRIRQSDLDDLVVPIPTTRREAS